MLDKFIISGIETLSWNICADSTIDERILRCLHSKENMAGVFKKYLAGKNFAAWLYNSTYYHRAENVCYIVRGAKKRKKLPLDGMDEEDIIQWICENEDYHCIADLCMGRGLVAIHAAKNGKKFLGTELNHKRLSVALETLNKMGFEYKIIDKEYKKQSQWTLNYHKKLKEVRFRMKPEEYERFEKAAKAGEYASMRAFFIDAINEKIKNLEEIEKNKL